MGICFIGKRNFSDFISDYMTPPSSSSSNNSDNKEVFVDVDTGDVVGCTIDTTTTTKTKTKRVYTIGQGAKLSGASRKWFVVGRSFDFKISPEKKVSTECIFVCGDTHHPALYSDELYVRQEDFNWIGGGGGETTEPSSPSPPPPPLVQGESMTALCRIRHLQPLFGCDVIWDRINARYIVKFHKPIRAVTPGQVVAIYVGKSGLICLGGGPIWDRGLSYHERGLDLPDLDQLHPSGNNDLSLGNK